jgi:hypothetical protein
LPVTCFRPLNFAIVQGNGLRQNDLLCCCRRSGAILCFHAEPATADLRRANKRLSPYRGFR